MANIKQKITPFLWTDSNAEEMAQFYVSVFKNAKILKTVKWSAETPSNKQIGSTMTVAFELEGQEFTILNGGQFFTFNESISFVVNCETQEEIDYYWEKLSANKEAEACGWCKDQFGVSWQIVPATLPELLTNADKKKSKRVTETLLKMKKLDIAKLKEAFDNK